MRIPRAIAVAFALALAASAPAADRVVYVKVGNAALKSGPKLSDPVVDSLRAGTPLTVIGQVGTKYQVKLQDGREGYVSSLQVSDEKPAGEGGGGSFLRDDSTASEASTSSSIRGLSEEAMQMANDKGFSQKAIDDAKQMETFAEGIKAKDVDEFAKDGKIGEDVP